MLLQLNCVKVSQKLLFYFPKITFLIVEGLESGSPYLFGPFVPGANR